MRARCRRCSPRSHGGEIACRGVSGVYREVPLWALSHVRAPRTAQRRSARTALAAPASALAWFWQQSDYRLPACIFGVQNVYFGCTQSVPQPGEKCMGSAPPSVLFGRANALWIHRFSDPRRADVEERPNGHHSDALNLPQTEQVAVPRHDAVSATGDGTGHNLDVCQVSHR